MIPVLSRYLHEKDRDSAWRLAGIVLSVGAVVLVGLTLIGEGLVWLLAAAGGDPRDRLTLGLVAAMLPYAILICLVAQLSAILHTLRHFTFPALAPVVLNVCWLTAILAVAPAVAEAPEARVYVLAGAILVAGVLQLAMQLVPLRRHGFRFQPSLDVAEPGFRQIVLTMAPMTLGLAITQINTLADSLIAYLFSSAGGAADALSLLGWRVAYPPCRPGRPPACTTAIASTSSRWACSASPWPRPSTRCWPNTRPRVGTTASRPTWPRACV